LAPLVLKAIASAHHGETSTLAPILVSLSVGNIWSKTADRASL